MWNVDRKDPHRTPLSYAVGRIVDDFSLGLRESAMKGRGAEFVGYRPYDPVDSARDIAWSAMARLPDDNDVVSYERLPERQLRVLVVADESISMRLPRTKPLHAEALVRLFALSTFETSDMFAIVGIGGDGTIFSGWLENEDAVDVFLKDADVPKQRHALRPTAATFPALLNELGLKNMIIIFLSDFVSSDRIPLGALREANAQKNVRCVAVVLDEWTGFVPSSHAVVLQHTESGRTAALDMREGGGVDREVKAFQDRIKALRDQRKTLKLSVFTVPLAEKDPLRNFLNQWERHFED